MATCINCNKTFKHKNSIYRHQLCCKNKIVKNNENNIDISINEIIVRPSGTSRDSDVPVHENTYSLEEMWDFMFWLSNTKQYMIYTLQEFEDIYKIYENTTKDEKTTKDENTTKDKNTTKDEKVINYNKINLKNIFEFSLMQILLLYFVIISSFA